jgi:hypothetical protein
VRHICLSLKSFKINNLRYDFYSLLIGRSLTCLRVDTLKPTPTFSLMTDLEKLTTDQMARAFDYLTNDEPDPPEDLQNLSRLEWGQLMGMLKIIMAERKGAPLH